VALRDGTGASRARPRLSCERGPRHAVLEDQVKIAVTADRISRDGEGRWLSASCSGTDSLG